MIHIQEMGTNPIPLLQHRRHGGALELKLYSSVAMQGVVDKALEYYTQGKAAHLKRIQHREAE